MAEQRTRFVGTYEHGLDDKGRMVLPSKIRAQLGETGMLGMLDGCLGLWSVDGFDEMADEIHRRVDAKEVPMPAFRQFMANAAEVTPDQQGRVVDPSGAARLRRPGLARWSINGRHDRAEIWDQVRWAAMTPDGNEPTWPAAFAELGL